MRATILQFWDPKSIQPKIISLQELRRQRQGAARRQVRSDLDQPAAGDAGGAVGALAAYHQFKGQPRVVGNTDGMSGAFSGPSSRRPTSMGNELDLLVVGRCVLKKAEQNSALKQDYSSAFELD